MNLRAQKTGRQRPWKKEEILEGLKHFLDKHSRYPTATEVDAYPYLPSSRSIERRFGGLVQLRGDLGLDGQHDYREGAHSTMRAHTINTRANKTEQVVYEFLVNRYGREFVHREYFFTDDRRTRADFFVYDSSKGFCVDVFYPSNRRNVAGCLNSKLKKYTNVYMRQYPVIFLQMNEEIPQDTLDELIKQKKKRLGKDQYLMAWGTFKTFAKTRTPLRTK